MAMQWSIPAGRVAFVSYVFSISGDALDQRGIVQQERPNVHESAPRGLSCTACTPYHAAYASVKAYICDRMTAATYNELEVLGKRKPDRSKHALKGIVRIVDATTGNT